MQQDLIQRAEEYLAGIQVEQDAFDQETERMFAEFDKTARDEIIRLIPELKDMEVEVYYKRGFVIISEDHYPILIHANIPFTEDDYGRPTYQNRYPITVLSIAVDWPDVEWTDDQVYRINSCIYAKDLALAVGLALFYAKVPEGITSQVRIVRCEQAVEAFKVIIPDALVEIVS